MILHLAKWIGEKSLAEINMKTALDIELRNLKRALVIACMEQLVRGYANGDECYHSAPKADCACFYVPKNDIQSRVSDIQKMAVRLFYASSNWSSTSHPNWVSTNLRMREVRLYWLATEDPIIIRNAHLLNKKTQNWASDADNALRKLSTILDIDVVHPPSDDDNQDNDFEDPDADTMSLVADFAAVSANSQSRPMTYNVNESSVEGDIQKFLNQHPTHFSKCKFKSYLSGFCVFQLNVHFKYSYSVCASNEIPLATTKALPPQGQYRPLGDAIQMYWSAYGNNFPKLAKCAERILKWPTVSTMIERAFSEMTSHFSKEGNRIHAETLLDIHHKKRASTDFIKALQATASAHKIETDS